MGKGIIFLLATLATLLAAAAGSLDISTPPHPVVAATCSSTLYPELCASTVMEAAVAAEAVRSSKDVLMTTLNHTIYTVRKNHDAIKEAVARKSLPPRDRVALRDCLEMISGTLSEIHGCEDMERNRFSFSANKERLLILLSAAQTNQETCLDGFSHGAADRAFRRPLVAGQIQVFRMVSNAMSIISKLSEEESAASGRSEAEDGGSGSGSGSGADESEWPKWMSAGDRRLLQQTTVTADVTVAADGSGNYRTISAAVAAAPRDSTRRYVIRIRAGTYRENVVVPRGRTNLMFAGDGRGTTIITGNRNVASGQTTTFHSATVAVVGDGFLARDLTIRNTAGPTGHQAVALRINADLSAVYRCNIEGYQDTLYVHSLRQFYTNCYITGTVDFIFGNAAVVFQDCDIQARRPGPGQRNMITAQSRDDPNQNTGIVIQRCRIGATADLQPVIATFPTYLGRPWREYSRTVVMQTEISNVIRPEGWFEWNGNFALNTLFYAEYANTGAGAATSNRVRWRGFRVLNSAAQAQPFTAVNFIASGNWIPATGFPYRSGL